MTPAEPEQDMSPGGFAARAFGGLMLDAGVNGAVFLSLVTLIAGIITKDPLWVTVGVVVGAVGIVMPWLALGMKWSAGLTLAIVVAVLLADIAAMAAMWKLG